MGHAQWVRYHVALLKEMASPVVQEKSTSPVVQSKEVLVVFKDRRRPIFFECSSDPQVEYQHILDSVKETFEDVLSTGEGSSESAGYYLQTDNKVWGRVDVNAKDKVPSHSILHIQLAKQGVSAASCSSIRDPNP